MIMVRKLALAAALAPMLLAGATHAAEPGFYLGASGGQTTVDKDAKDLGLDTSSITALQNFEIDDSDTGWKAYLGYQFLPWLGIEGGYVDLGSASKTRTVTNASGTDFRANGNADFTGWEGFLVGTIPIGPVDLFAKVGGANLKVDGNVNVTNLDTSESNRTSGNDNDAQLAYGVGAAYNFGKGHWGLRVEAEGYDDNEVDDLYFISAGIVYRFFEDPAPVVAAAPVVEAPPAACADGDNDGVCDSDDQCPNTPAGKTVDEFGCDCSFAMQLNFEFDSAELTAGDVAQLDKISTVLANPKVASIGGSVVGHTDSVGSEAYNMGLSQRRAESVANHLRSQGVDVGAWTVTGMGESQPIASNDTAEGRAQNRRVDVTRTECGK